MSCEGQAAKRWAAEDLPLRRGQRAALTARDTINALAALSQCLRLSRQDRGESPGMLGRPDILAFTSQLAHLQRTGQMTFRTRLRVTRRDTWGHLFSAAEREIGVLVYTGLFLSEDAGVQKIFKDKAKAGVRGRILLGEPDSQVVADRGEDEGVGDAQAAKIRNALALYRPLRAVDGVEFRHGATSRSAKTA